MFIHFGISLLLYKACRQAGDVNLNEVDGTAIETRDFPISICTTRRRPIAAPLGLYVAYSRVDTCKGNYRALNGQWSLASTDHYTSPLDHSCQMAYGLLQLAIASDHGWEIYRPISTILEHTNNLRSQGSVESFPN